MYQSREYCSDKEYAKISGRKSDKASRCLNREVRREMQWDRYAPKQEIDGVLDLRELEAALHRLKPKKSGGQDGVALELVQ